MRPNSVTQTTSVSSKGRGISSRDQGRRRLIEDRRVNVVLGFDRFVSVPIADPSPIAYEPLKSWTNRTPRSKSRRASRQFRAKPALTDSSRACRTAIASTMILAIDQPLRPPQAASSRRARNWRSLPRVRVAGMLLQTAGIQFRKKLPGRLVRRRPTVPPAVRDSNRLIGVERCSLNTAGRNALFQLFGPVCGLPAGVGNRTKAGRSAHSLPVHNSPGPDAGKPSSVNPVLIWFSAGPCVLLFAVSEWMKQRSSASSARFGSSSETILPDSPRGLNCQIGATRFPFSPWKVTSFPRPARLSVALHQFRLVIERVHMADRTGAKIISTCFGRGSQWGWPRRQRSGRINRRPNGRRPLPPAIRRQLQQTGDRDAGKTECASDRKSRRHVIGPNIESLFPHKFSNQENRPAILSNRRTQPHPYLRMFDSFPITRT